jgi:cation diffusion facilitator family transporter
MRLRGEEEDVDVDVDVDVQDGINISSSSPVGVFQAVLNHEKMETIEKVEEEEEEEEERELFGIHSTSNIFSKKKKKNPCSNCLTKCSRTLCSFLNCKCSIKTFSSPPMEDDTRWDQKSLALQLTLGANVLIVVSMSIVAIATGSLALLSSLIENMVDLFVQALLWYAGSRMRKKPDYAKFPVGTSRFEPVAVIVTSSIMSLVSVMIIQESIKRLIEGFTHGNKDQRIPPQLSSLAIAFGVLSIGIKILLYLYCQYVYTNTKSSAIDAIRQDNRNDAISNAFAMTAYLLASIQPTLWFVDALGAMLLFVVILFSWAKMAKTQMMQLIGICASEEFIDQVKEICAQHHPSLMYLDRLKAYHFGTKYLVEIEVVFPAKMTVKQAHDLALELQFKIEQLDQVERAFVHVDYQERTYDEHRVSHDENALVLYCGQEEEKEKEKEVACSSVTCAYSPMDNTTTGSTVKEENGKKLQWSTLPSPVKVTIQY